MMMMMMRGVEIIVVVVEEAEEGECYITVVSSVYVLLFTNLLHLVQ